MIYGAFAAMIAAGAFLIIITNMIVGSRVGALEDSLAKMAAYQNNPVTVTSGTQTGVAAGSCVAPVTAEAAGEEAASSSSP